MITIDSDKLRQTGWLNILGDDHLTELFQNVLDRLQSNCGFTLSSFKDDYDSQTAALYKSISGSHVIEAVLLLDSKGLSLHIPNKELRESIGDNLRILLNS